MILHNIEQRSEEWEEIRRGKLTASDFSKIITKTGKLSSQYIDVLYKNLSEINTLTKEFYPTNFYMERGVELEDEAIIAYEQATSYLVEKVGFIESGCGLFGVSPDGMIKDDGLVEIKCLMQKKHLSLLVGDDSAMNEYIPQIQFQLFISKREWVDFVSFNPDFIEKQQRIFIKRIFIDNDYHKLIKVALEKYKEKFIELSKVLENNNIF